MSYIDNLFSLESKLAVVTGAARGNGKAIAEALLRAGATVVLVDRLKAELSKTTKSLKHEGLKAIMYTCDISITSKINDLVRFVINEFNKIDILVNNAGVTYSHPLVDYPDRYWDKTYRVNLKAIFELSREVAKYMIKQKSGVIINITSLNAELAFPDNPAYASFKGALKQLSKSLALDLGKHGIRVNNVGPGYFKTDMTRKSWQDPELYKQRSERTVLNRWGQPSDLAGLVILLSSDASSYITGQDIYVDGGWLIKGL
jgi:gluconate 5-dehydrogenase